VDGEKVPLGLKATSNGGKNEPIALGYAGLKASVG